jgi:hypothetical protein
VLSTVFVGQQLLRRPDLHFSKADFQAALAVLRPMILRARRYEFVGIPQGLAFSCVDPKERSD